MKEIFDFLESRYIDAKIISASDVNFDRIEFKLHDCDISIKLLKEITLNDFVEQVNNQYLDHLKTRRDFYKRMLKCLNSEIDNYQPYLTI